MVVRHAQSATVANVEGVTSSPIATRGLSDTDRRERAHPVVSNVMPGSNPPTGSTTKAPSGSVCRGKKVSALINRGVEWENWLVGLQHKFLLGVAPSTDSAVSGGSAEGACQGGGTTSRSPSTFKRSNTPRQRCLYQMVEKIADFSERASFHPGFLCWAYVSRLLASGLFFLVACYLNALATMVSTHRNPYAMMLDRFGVPLDQHTLPDLGHDLWAYFLTRLGHHTDYIDEHSLPDRMVVFAGKVTFLFIVCHPHRLKILRRVFTIFGTVLMMRAVSVTVTVLPDASPVCRERFSQQNFASYPDLFPRAFYEAAQFVWAPTSFVTCGDMIFSGHTTCLLMAALIFRKYCRAKHLQTKVIWRGFHLRERELFLVRNAVYAYVALGCLVIIGSKLHYTLDVLLAILVSVWVFTGYHEWARHPKLRKKVRFLQWLESDDVLDQDDLAYSRARRP